MVRLVRLVSFIGLFALVLLPGIGRVQGSSPSTSTAAQVTSDPSEEAFRFQVDEFQEFDARTRLDAVAPTPEQLDTLVGLRGATTRWNHFGSARSLINYRGYVTGDPLTNSSASENEIAQAVRNWIGDNRALFQLPAADEAHLELVHNLQLVNSQARALLFRQRFDGLAAISGGLIAVGFAEGKIAYVAASTAKWNGASLGTPQLSAQDAWLKAATDVQRAAGVSLSDIAVTQAGSADDWTLLQVNGFGQTQRARLRAMPMPTRDGVGGARLVYDTVVYDVRANGDAFAYSHLIDASTGEVLLRHNRKQHAADYDLGASHVDMAPLPAPVTTTFSGKLTATECRANSFDVPSGKTSIVVRANSTNADMVLKLLFNELVLATSDAATSPEAVTYSPAGGVPPGQYTVQVCSFGGTSAESYNATFTTDDSPAAEPNQIAYPPKFRYFEANPPLDLANTDTRVLRCWEAVVNNMPVADCDPRPLKDGGQTVWDENPRTGQSTFTTVGNNAQTGESLFSPLTPSNPNRPTSANRTYNFPWTNQWLRSKCNPGNFGTPERNDLSAATANLFALHNRVHDWSYLLGFTEKAYNLQDSNLGKQGREGDPEIGNVQAGAVNGGSPSYTGRDNANQITLQDGVPPITNMYLWQPIAGAFYSPCVDGDYDMSVVGHEYGHAIQNRMVAGPDDGLGTPLGRSMGESWSDLTAAEYLNEYGFVPNGGENPFAVGPYVTGNKQSGIRTYGMNQSPLNYADVEYDGGGITSPHADGEIWSATNFDIRQALIAKYDAQFPSTDRDLQVRCANGNLGPEACPGNRRWFQILMDAFLLELEGVTMDDARDAYLAADRMRFGGANQAELHRAFAVRGLGVGTNPDGSNGANSVNGNDKNPTPSFASPLEQNASITFQAVGADRAGQPALDAHVFVGVYEARAIPIADTDPSTPFTGRLILPVDANTGAQGQSVPFTRTIQSTAQFVPGTYEFRARAPGYGIKRFTLTFAPGQVETITIPMATNLASAANGSVATGNGAPSGTTNADRNLDKLIDDTEETNYARINTTTANTPGGMTVDKANVHVTVKLADGTPHTINRIQVSAVQRPQDTRDRGGDTASQSRFSALRQFDIYTCNTATGVDCTKDEHFTLAYNSPADTFPGARPRPNVDQLRLREFPLPPNTVATHVQIRVVHNQCTGGPDFQGEQDNDPADATDCDTGTVGGRAATAGRNVRIAELQVFSSDPNITVAPPATTATPGITAGPTQEPTPGGPGDDDPRRTPEVPTTTATAEPSATTTAEPSTPTTIPSGTKLYMPFVAR